MSHFDELFGLPELTRRANWDGKEEPLHATKKPLMAMFMPVDTGEPTLIRFIDQQDTIDIDHEVVD